MTEHDKSISDKTAKIHEDITDVTPKEFLQSIEKEYAHVSDDEKKSGAMRVQSFINGDLNWAELMRFTPDMLFQIAEYGFNQFNTGRNDDAERVFKVLTVLDDKNAYYHSVMGSILQRQKRFAEAIAEYTQAIELDNDDVVSLTNRGEIFLSFGLLDDAETDFQTAIQLSDSDDPFVQRSHMLLVQLQQKQKQET